MNIAFVVPGSTGADLKAPPPPHAEFLDLHGLAQSAEMRLAVVRACLSCRWDIALLCVGFPAQGMIARQLAELGRQSGIALCVGASIDFLTGAQKRAPLRLRQFGLEWTYRLATQPRRLWRRYLVESPKIARIFLKAQLARLHVTP